MMRECMAGSRAYNALEEMRENTSKTEPLQKASHSQMKGAQGILRDQANLEYDRTKLKIVHQGRSPTKLTNENDNSHTTFPSPVKQRRPLT